MAGDWEGYCDLGEVSYLLSAGLLWSGCGTAPVLGTCDMPVWRGGLCEW